MKKLFFLALFFTSCFSIRADEIQITLYVPVSKIGNTTFADISKNIEGDLLSYSCVYTADKKGVTVTAYVSSTVKEKDVKDKVKAEKDKIKVVTSKTKENPTPTITATTTTATAEKVK